MKKILWLLAVVFLLLCCLNFLRADVYAESSAETQDMYRLFNPVNGEHFYTAKEAERNMLVLNGWRYEGVGWVAPVHSDTPVYRLFSPVTGDHHYTANAAERDMLTEAGWNYEGIGWYSDDLKRVPLYRQYNPHARTGSHNYTTNKGENDYLTTVGWNAEGIGWYACAGGRQAGNSWVMTQYCDVSGSQAMFYTMKNTVTGTLIVIDGGTTANHNYVRQVIKSLGGRVDYWFITHFHDDHVSAFNAIFARPKGIKIGQVYSTSMDYYRYKELAKEWDFPDVLKTFLIVTANRPNVHILKRGDRLNIDGLTFEFFNAYDSLVSDMQDMPNNASLVFKVSGQKDSILFCGDAHSPELADLLLSQYGDRIKAEYVSPGHHGNGSFPESFYAAVDPDVMLFDAPSWLINDTKKYTASALRGWCQSQGIKVYDQTTAPNAFLFE
ncbi:MAG: MBL fold metallo-hydrolase [Eubacterium sp.]|nr:MBL fold metallo-hydrolase [Eubacterium sp.]